VQASREFACHAAIGYRGIVCQKFAREAFGFIGPGGLPFAATALRLPRIGTARRTRSQVSGAQFIKRALSHSQALADFANADLLDVVKAKQVPHESAGMTGGNLELFFSDIDP